MKKKILYISDLDGTLLNRQEQISFRSLALLNSLIDQGLLFTYATARSLTSARKVTEGLRLRVPVIVYNGAFLMDAHTGEIQHACRFTKQENTEAQRIFQKYNAYPFVYTFEEGKERVFWYTGGENSGMRRYLDSRRGDPRFGACQSSNDVYRGEIFYYTCIGTFKALQPLSCVFQEDPRYFCTFQKELYTEEEYWLEVMPKKSTKAEGVLRLKQMLGCDRVVSFGDAINDIPMFRISDEAYAVENAVPELKKEASGIVSSNEENGVAEWLFKNAEIQI